MKCFTLIVAILVNTLVISAQEKKAVTTPVKEKYQISAKQILKKDTSINIRLTRSKFDYFKKNNIDLGTKASELMEKYSVPPIADIENVPPKLVISDSANSSQQESKKIISKRIIDDGGFEKTYSDGSKYILFNGGFTIIPPKGNPSQVLYSQVPEFVPPTSPGDPNLTLFLNNINDKLIAVLSGLLENDSTSIANYKKGEANLNIYETINRRFKFINYAIGQK
jgi:hypothetical protein